MQREVGGIRVRSTVQPHSVGCARTSSESALLGPETVSFLVLRFDENLNLSFQVE